LVEDVGRHQQFAIQSYLLEIMQED